MNKYERARQYFQNILFSVAKSEEYGVNQTGIFEISVAIEALEKQIPKKVIEKVNTEPLYDDNGMIDDFIDIVTFECSCCNNTIATGEIDRYCCAEICYCDNCGQKLDWESDTK